MRVVHIIEMKTLYGVSVTVKATLRLFITKKTLKLVLYQSHNFNKMHPYWVGTSKSEDMGSCALFK